MNITRHILTFLTFITSTALFAQVQPTRLVRDPAINTEHIAFVYADDIWIARHDGSNVRRITTYAGSEYDPQFSPDGQQIAFTGQYDGNTDVYVVSVDGGEPRRLTFHPQADQVRGWTPDGSAVLFASGRARVPYPLPDQFWTVSLAEHAFPQPFRVPRVTRGQYSPDGRRFAYQMIFPWESEFRNYRGGQNNPIRIIDLETLEVEKLPWEDSNDKEPVWIDNTVYFLSDRNYAMNVWAYDTESKQLSQATSFSEFDCKNLASGGGLLAFENGGTLYTLDPTQGEPQQVDITVEGDFAWARPHWVDAHNKIQQAAISPTGQRAIFSARGDIFTVPAKKGSIRNLTSSPGAADRSPAWSPGGQQVSWFSDESGEYALIIADQYGDNIRKISLDKPTYYYTPAWSPDSKYISFGDADRNLWVVDISSEKAILVDNEGYAHPERTIYPAWSPDSKWVAYTRRLDNEYNAIFTYSLEEAKSYQITDGLSDSRSPTWSLDGKYLYFMASTDYGLNVGWLDMTSYDRPLNRAIYALVLSADDPSPVALESDDETSEEAKEDEKEETGDDKESEQEETLEVTIDWEGLSQRIVALDIPSRTYTALKAADGSLYYTERVVNQSGQLLHQYKMKERETEEVLEKVQSFFVSGDGKKLLYQQQGNQWGILNTAKPKPSEGKLTVAGMMMKVDPQVEAKQIFQEAWRFQRDYFYVENVHGMNLEKVYENYSPWVADIRHRSDLTYLLDILGGETSVGHSFVGGGDYPDIDRVPVGLLGADYEQTDGRYRITKIYTGESWNPNLRSPLSGPAISVQEGDYLLSVNGQEISDSVNLYAYFAQTADRQTRIQVNSQPTLEGARELIVVPVANEAGLRQYDWIESNRRKVDELSNGKLAYVWLPNTGNGGYDNFNRYYFAQKDKLGAIIDERFNQGGSAADYIVDLLSRELMGYFNNPVGDKKPFTSPSAGIWGPKVMIVNEMAGSGGDYLPYMFKKKNIGPVVGTRTWGGLVGIWDVPPLVDGGRMTSPRGGFYNTEGKWAVENEGVAPNIEVEQEPKLVAAGRDPQLEKAVEVALELLEENPLELQAQPSDPVRARRPSDR
ncbi:MAG: PDZ domain-containing protein [Bacteroidota bacterium]